MISKLSSPYRFYNRSAHVTGAVALKCYSKNSIDKFATIGGTGLPIYQTMLIYFTIGREISCGSHKFEELHNVRDEQLRSVLCLLPLSSLLQITSSALSIGLLVKRETTSCEFNISSSSIMILAMYAKVI